MSSSPPSAAIDVLSDATLVPLALIDDAPDQPRQQLPDVEDLAASIKAFGLLQPVALRRVGARYQVMAGHRRVAAFRWLQSRQPSRSEWSAILALVTRADDETAHMAMVNAQVHVVGWSAAEEHQVLQRLNNMGMTLEEIAAVLHKTKGWASRRLRVYEDPELAKTVESGELSASVVELALPIRDHAARAAVVDTAAQQRWSQRRMRHEVRARSAASKVEIAPAARSKLSTAESAEIHELRRVARELLKVIRRVKVEEIPADLRADLVALRKRIEAAVPRPVEVAA